MKKEIALYSLIILFASIICAKSQTIPTERMVKAPDASAFDKMIETPVSYYTGIPNISIPLYEISIKGVTVPISLNYQAGGIRVDEEATIAGLGWSLDYGGQISRTVKGKPDEKSFFNAGRLLPGWSSFSIATFMNFPHANQDPWMSQRMSYARFAKDSFYPHDYMPDEFYYSAQGFSGRFMYNQSGNKFVFFPKEDIKVDYAYVPEIPVGYNYKPIDTWTMLLPSGTSLIFGSEGTTSTGQ